MEELKKQVARAHRRLTFQRFLRVLTWSLFGTFLVAAIAIAIPKIWAISASETLWTRGWLIGAAVGGLLIAGVWAMVNRRSPLEAAIEIDQRFGLKERVSSTYALSETELQSEAGQALVNDASRRVAKIDVGEKFKTKGHWSAVLPFVPAAIAFLLILLPNVKQAENQVNATSLPVTSIQKSAEELKKKWAEKKKQLEDKNLEAAKLFNAMEKSLDKMSDREDIDKKQAMVKLNDLGEAIKKRRDEIGDAKKLQEQLNQLKSLKPGPASEMAKAMKQGNFEKAAGELSKMVQKMQSGEMTAKEKEQLAKQMQNMADKLQQMAQAQKDAKEELKRQVEQAKKEGDRAKAGELQRKLDKLNQQNKQMQKMQKMAQKMQQCSDCMKQGQGKGQKAQAAQKAAQQAMQEMAEQMQEMAEEMGEMEMLDEAMEQLADAKDQMNCKACNGMGCKECQGKGKGQGQGQGQGKGKGKGDGMGEGQGSGARPEDKNADGTFYETQVRGQIRRGKTVATGMANGKNMAGEALEEVRDAIEAASNESADPLTNVRLPKEYRDHVREYLDSVGGNDE